MAKSDRFTQKPYSPPHLHIHIIESWQRDKVDVILYAAVNVSNNMSLKTKKLAAHYK